MYSARNYIQYHVINHNGKNYKKDIYIYIYIYMNSLSENQKLYFVNQLQLKILKIENGQRI